MVQRGNSGAMPTPTHDDLALAASWLEAVVEDRALLDGMERDERIRLLKAAGMVARPDKDAKRKLNRAGRKRILDERREEDQALLALAQIRKMRDNPIFQTPRRQGVSTPQQKQLQRLMKNFPSPSKPHMSMSLSKKA